MTAKHEALLSEMMRSHALGDMCLLGGRGVGKSAVVNKVRWTELVQCFSDNTTGFQNGCDLKLLVALAQDVLSKFACCTVFGLHRAV